MNALKTTFLLTALTLILVLAGEYLGGTDGAWIAFAIAAGTNFFSYFYSDKIALAMYGAQPVTREQLPRAYQVVERLTGRAGLPMPKIYVIPTESPNAFATGRNPQHASVAVTHGILGLLNDEELEGVLAHELGHVRNRDILTSSIAATLAGAITILARMAFWFGAFGGGDRRDRRRWRPRRPRHADRRPLRSHADSALGLPHPRVRGRRLRRPPDWKPVCPGQRPRKDRRREPTRSADGLAQFGAPVHRPAAPLGRDVDEPFFDPSAHPEAH